MRAKLISREHGEFAFEQVATVGRVAGNTVVLAKNVVSHEHARISFDNQLAAYVLEDLDSLNGTYLDGLRLDRKEVLSDLHVIQFGDQEDFVFQLLNADPGVAPESEGETLGVAASGKTQVGGEVPTLPASLRESGTRPGIGRTRVEKVAVPLPGVLAQASADDGARAAAESGFALEVSLGDHTERFALQVGDNVVGRSRTAQIQLVFPDLSRRHATLIVAGGAVRVRDEGSRNRTFLNGQPIDTEVLVPIGAKIVFGRLEARLIATESDTASKAAEPKD